MEKPWNKGTLKENYDRLMKVSGKLKENEPYGGYRGDGSAFRVGDEVMIARDNDNESYDDFRDKVLIVTHIARSTRDHPGYDTNVGGALMDFETEDGEEVPFSLYDWEVEYA